MALHQSDSGGRDFVTSAVKKLKDTNTLTPEALAKDLLNYISAVS